MTVLYDGCLEANRRLAWARFYQMREHAEQIAWWAAEIGEHLVQMADTAGLDVHQEVRDLLDLVHDALPGDSTSHITRYVALRRGDPTQGAA